jgi:hypothetical protein
VESFGNHDGGGPRIYLPAKSARMIHVRGCHGTVEKAPWNRGKSPVEPWTLSRGTADVPWNRGRPQKIAEPWACHGRRTTPRNRGGAADAGVSSMGFLTPPPWGEKEKTFFFKYTFEIFFFFLSDRKKFFYHKL